MIQMDYLVLFITKIYWFGQLGGCPIVCYELQASHL
jgi:hypothetical protein